jgi:hypothetical protein
MTTKLLLFAFYYLAIALFAPNPVDGPNKFAVYMLWVSLFFSILSFFSFLWSVLPEDRIVEEYEGESVDFAGMEVQA